MNLTYSLAHSWFFSFAFRCISSNSSYRRVKDVALRASCQFVGILNRRKLCSLSAFRVNVVREICLMWRAVMSMDNSKQVLLQANNSSRLFVKVVQIVFNDDCHHCQLPSNAWRNMLSWTVLIVPPLARALFNIFTSNYLKELNRCIHQSKLKKER